MAGISDIVEVTITVNSRFPTRAGFGTPVLMAYFPTARFSELIRTFRDLTELASLGFTTWHPVYRMAQALLSQNPRPETFKVARLPAAHTHTQTVTITSAVEGAHVKLTVISPTTGVETAIDYTIPAAATTTTVATAVEALIEAVAGVASSAAVAVITVTPDTPGDMVFIHSLTNCDIKDTTADANYETALTALQAVDDDWYLVLLDVNSEANVDDVAAWAETRTKLFIWQTMNSEEANGTGTAISQQKALGYDRTDVEFVAAIHQYQAAALAGVVLPRDPGSITWAFKELKGITPVVLTTTQETTLLGNNANVYQTIAGLGTTRYGKSVGGEYMDVTHGIDWLKAQIQERVFTILSNAGKVPFTDAGVDSVVAEVLAALKLAVTRGLLSAGTISASGPKVADVSPADKAARTLPDVKFAGTLAGAVHKVKVQGTVSV